MLFINMYKPYNLYKIMKYTNNNNNNQECLCEDSFFQNFMDCIKKEKQTTHEISQTTKNIIKQPLINK